MTAETPDRRATIIEGAATLFARHGFAAVGLDEIGAAVGFSGPAIYRYFAGKEQLFAAVVQFHLARIDQSLEDGLEEGHDPDGVVCEVISAAHPHAQGLAMILREPGRLDSRTAETVDGRLARVTRPLAEAVAAVHPGVDELTMAIRVRAMLAPVTAVAVRTTAVLPARQIELLQRGARAVLHAPIRPTPVSTRDIRWAPAGSRRSEILRAALRLFRERGYHGVPVQEIAEAAGISSPTIYHYYESKSDILVDAYERADHRVVAGALDAVADASSACDALARLARSFTRIAVENIDLTIVTARELDSLPVDQRPQRARGRRLTREIWMTALREAHPDLADAELLLVQNATMLLIQHAAQVAESQPERQGEIASLALAFALSGSACEGEQSPAELVGLTAGDEHVQI